MDAASIILALLYGDWKGHLISEALATSYGGQHRTGEVTPAHVAARAGVNIGP